MTLQTYFDELIGVGLCFILFYFCFNLNSVVLFMCPNVAFGRSESHSWFILIDGPINSPSSFFILRAAKSRFTHPVPAQYSFTYIKVGLDIFSCYISFSWIQAQDISLFR